MTRSWRQVIMVPLHIVFQIFGEKDQTNKGSYSNLSASDWNIHSDFIELKIENERLKFELQKYTKIKQ